MKTAVFTWDANKQGESPSVALKELQSFCKDVEVLFITQGAFTQSIHGYTVFYKEKALNES